MPSNIKLRNNIGNEFSITHADNVGSVEIKSGNVAPEGAIVATVGSLYIYSNGTSGALYVKQSGTGNTGWVVK